MKGADGGLRAAKANIEHSKSQFRFGVESLGTAATSLFGLLISIPTLAITAHWLGPQGRGVFVTTITWSALGATCCGFSLGFVAIHEMTGSGSKDVGPLVGTSLALAAAESMFGWIVIGVLYQIDRTLFGSSARVLCLGFLGMPCIIVKEYLGAVRTGQSRISVYNRAQVCGNVLAFVLLGGLVLVHRLSVEAAIVAWLLGQIAVCTMSFVDIRRRIHGFGIRGKLVHSLLSGGYKLHLNAIGAILIASIDVLMVNSFVGSQEVGNYQLAVKLVTNVTLPAQAVSSVMYGRIVEFGPDRTWTFVRRICLIKIVFVMGGTLSAAWFAPLIIKIIAGELFSQSVPLFRLMLIATPGLSFSYLMAPQWICRGFFWQAGGLTFLTASANMLGNWLLVSRYGAVGAAYRFVGVYVLSILGNGSLFAFCE